MKGLCFHLQGKMAHFRRYYSNSSALSYSIPPRTTLCGMIAGLLGYERDQYYSDFSLQNCDIAVAIVQPIKKQIQKLNLLKVESVNDLNGSQSYHSQIATELILPENIREGIIDYKIWFTHRDNTIMNKLENLFKKSYIGYPSMGMPISLGTAYNLGWIQYEGCFEGELITIPGVVTIMSACPLKIFKNIIIEHGLSVPYRLAKEDVPLEFDGERRITIDGIGEMIVNLAGQPLLAELDEHIRINGMKEVIEWMK